MVTAVVLVKAKIDAIPSTAQTVADLPGVAEVYSVAGRWDLVVLVKVREHDELEQVITTALDKVPGIESTETLIAFRTYSKHDVEAGWALGFEEAD